MISSEWAAIHSIPDNVAELGALSDPAEDSLLSFDFALGIVKWIPEAGFSVTAADVSYTPPAGFGADVQTALDDVIDVLDDLQTQIDASAVIVSGSFTCTLNFDGSPVATGTMYYYIVGELVTMHLHTTALVANTGSGSNHAMTLSGIPSACRAPSGQTRGMHCGVVISAGSMFGYININDDGTATLYAPVVSGTRAGFSSTAFDFGSGNTGIVGGFSITYSIEP